MSDRIKAEAYDRIRLAWVSATAAIDAIIEDAEAELVGPKVAGKPRLTAAERAARLQAAFPKPGGDQ